MTVNGMVTTVHISTGSYAIKYKDYNTRYQHRKYNDTIGIIVYRLHNISP